MLALAFVPLLGNRLTASRAHETMARDFAYDILNSVEPYGILITAGDNDTFPLWYAQEVEGIRPDVTLANLSLMNTDWHLRQLARRKTPAFDPARADPIWRSFPAGPPPTTPPLKLTQAEVDSLPEAMQVPSKGGIAVRQPADPVRAGRAAAPGPGHHFPDPRQQGGAARSSSAGATAAIPIRPSV